MAVKHREAIHPSRKESIAQSARALNVDPEWLRTGEGCSVRRDASKAAMLGVYEKLSPKDRGTWTAWGRILLAATARA